MAKKLLAKGIDVSKWQGDIDWGKVKAAGIDFAILRCGYGSDRTSQDDVKFARNVAECERLSIPYGVYLYSYATDTTKAKSEAEHVLRLIKGKKFAYPVFYDLEDAPTTGKCTNAQILNIAKTFVEIIENAGYTCGIYANKHWNETKLTDAWYNTKPRWLAQYNTKVTYNGDYDIWQYTSAGKVNGVKGNCDMNYCYTEFGKTVPIGDKPIKSVELLAQEVLAGKYGNGDDRKKALGDRYDEVQQRVNEIIAERAKAANKAFSKGDKVALKNAPLFASATATKATSKKTGNYYIYDGVKTNNRYRITNKKENCGKKPIGQYVTGWVEL